MCSSIKCVINFSVFFLIKFSYEVKQVFLLASHNPFECDATKRNIFTSSQIHIKCDNTLTIDDITHCNKLWQDTRKISFTFSSHCDITLTQLPSLASHIPIKRDITLAYSILLFHLIFLLTVTSHLQSYLLSLPL